MQWGHPAALILLKAALETASVGILPHWQGKRKMIHHLGGGVLVAPHLLSYQTSPKISVTLQNQKLKIHADFTSSLLNPQVQMLKQLILCADFHNFSCHGSACVKLPSEFQQFLYQLLKCAVQ